MPTPGSSNGLFGQLQGSLGAVLALARVRLALLGTELELEKHRVGQGLFWAAAALMSLTVAAVLLCALVILLLWDGYRLAAVAVLAGSFLVLGLFLIKTAQQHLRAPSNLFSVSLDELERDRAALESRPPHAP